MKHPEGFSERMGEGFEQIRENVEETREKLEDAVDEAKDRVEEVWKDAKTLTRKHPGAAVGLALVIGAALGILLSGRRKD